MIKNHAKLYIFFKIGHKNLIFLQIEFHLNHFHLLFQVVDCVDELLFARHVHAHVFGHLRADIMHEFPHLFDLADVDFERAVDGVERVKLQISFIDVIFDDFEYYAVVDGEDDIGLTVANVVPVEDVFAGDVRPVGDRQHRVTADLEGAVFSLFRQEWQLERREDADVLWVGVTRCVSGLCAFAHELDVLAVAAVDGGGEHPDIAAFDMHVVAALELAELELADLSEVDLYQGVDGDVEVFREGDESLDVGLRHLILVSAER